MQLPALRPYQTDVKRDVFAAWNSGIKNVLVTLPTGAGKCLARDTPVLMHDGRVLDVQDVQVGDALMGPDGTPRNVLSLASGSEMMYQVTPTKGDAYTVNESHILSLRITGRDNVTAPSGIVYKPGEIVDISVTDYLPASKTFKHVAKGWRSGEIEFQRNDLTLPIPSYILGIWLGDGNSRLPEICSVDSEVINEWVDYAILIDHQIIVKDAHRVPIYSIKSKEGSTIGRGYKPNHFFNKLRHLNVLCNKHIPHEYKTATVNNRLEILAGIIDTDGYLNHGGYDLVFKQSSLANDVAFIARSLGLAAYVKPCRKICTNNGSVGDYHRVSINGDIDKIPCRVARRKAPPRLQKKNVTNVGITVKPIGVGEYYGFTIDGDRRFLLGDFTVTHNTVLFCDIIRELNLPTVAIAHRRELVSQMSCTLAANGIRHRIIGPASVIKTCVALHMMRFGESYFNANADVAVAGVDTLVNRADELKRFCPRVRLLVQDEGHHLVQGNKWGKAVDMFPNAKLLGVTATPDRADGKGLGADNDGYFESIVIGPTMRELIEQGYLTDYIVYSPPNDLDLSDVKIGASGDYSKEGATKAVKRSHILGDVVTHYLRHASGKLGVTFVPDVSTGMDVTAKFNAAGVRAEMVSAKTPDLAREDILRRFAKREIMQLVNVDLFGEGFDLPAIEVCSFARPTESNSLFVQQLGRVLRLMEGKDIAIIIDHVGNYMRHCVKYGRPDTRKNWTLDRRTKRASGPSDAIPMTACVECTASYERVLHRCPYCGNAPIIADRSSPEYVDGDLVLLDDAILNAMLGEIKTIEQPLRDGYVQDPRTASIAKNHEQRREVHSALKTVIDWWGAFQRAQGRDDRESYKRFYFMFGVDILSCQTLPKPDAIKLAEQISTKLVELTK